MALQARTLSGISGAWMVHLFTASGAIFGLLAIQATSDQRFIMAIVWMMVTSAIDSVDGALARFLRVKYFVPHFDGALLDNIMDYFTYVVVPAYFLLHVDIVPLSWRLPLAGMMILTSAYQFCRDDAKTPDHAFTGFPSYWNVAVFYLYLLEWPEGINAFVLVLCGLAVFIPIRYLYPSRTPVLRPLNIFLGTIWAGLAMAALVQYPIGHKPLLLLSFFYLVYYLVFSLWLTLRKYLAAKKPATQ